MEDKDPNVIFQRQIRQSLQVMCNQFKSELENGGAVHDVLNFQEEANDTRGVE
jgi:hypothetical protein